MLAKLLSGIFVGVLVGITALADQPKTQLQLIMDQMGNDFKSIGMQISDASKNESTLLFVKDLEVQVPKAAQETPKSAAHAADVTAFMADYHATLAQLLGLVQQLDADLQANANDKAMTVLQQISDLKKAAHKKFDI